MKSSTAILILLGALAAPVAFAQAGDIVEDIVPPPGSLVTDLKTHNGQSGCDSVSVTAQSPGDVMSAGGEFYDLYTDGNYYDCAGVDQSSDMWYEVSYFNTGSNGYATCSDWDDSLHINDVWYSDDDQPFYLDANCEVGTSGTSWCWDQSGVTYFKIDTNNVGIDGDYATAYFYAPNDPGGFCPSGSDAG